MNSLDNLFVSHEALLHTFSLPVSFHIAWHKRVAIGLLEEAVALLELAQELLVLAELFTRLVPQRSSLHLKNKRSYLES